MIAILLPVLFAATATLCNSEDEHLWVSAFNNKMLEIAEHKDSPILKARIKTWHGSRFPLFDDECTLYLRWDYHLLDYSTLNSKNARQYRTLGITYFNKGVAAVIAFDRDNVLKQFVLDFDSGDLLRKERVQCDKYTTGYDNWDGNHDINDIETTVDQEGQALYWIEWSRERQRVTLNQIDLQSMSCSPVGDIVPADITVPLSQHVEGLLQNSITGLALDADRDLYVLGKYSLETLRIWNDPDRPLNYRPPKPEIYLYRIDRLSGTIMETKKIARTSGESVSWIYGMEFVRRRLK